MTPDNRKPGRSTARIARPDSGFTLLEIMIVLGIIAMIFGFLILPAVTGKSAEAKAKMTQVKLGELVAAYERWSVDNYEEDCPSDIQELSGTKKKKPIKDGFGREIVMRCGNDAPDGEPFGVSSSGPDKKMDTEDDINSWDL